MRPKLRLLRARALSLGLVVSMAGPVMIGCEPDEGPPPQTPQNPPPQATPPAPPDPPPAPTAAAGDPQGEYAIGADSDSYEDDDPTALTDFHTTLDPYGSWVDDPTYGTVWVPASNTVGTEFRPYVTAGHWVYDDDWTWVSDYPWGWAPFHYGRWVLVEGRGWVWIPGRAYRGAWVVWSVDDGYDYLGWAPAPPLFVWFGGAPVVWRGPYRSPGWVYCPHRDVFTASVGTRVIVGAAAAPIAGRMRVFTPAANVHVSSGPPPARFGFSAAQIPHAAGPGAGNVARAQEFSRPSTAQALGARPPTMRVQPAARAAAGPMQSPRPMEGPRPLDRTGQGQTRLAPVGPSASPGPARVAPATGPAPVPRSNAAPAVVPRVGAPHPAPTFRGTGRFGGGGHRR